MGWSPPGGHEPIPCRSLDYFKWTQQGLPAPALLLSYGLCLNRRVPIHWSFILWLRVPSTRRATWEAPSGTSYLPSEFTRACSLASGHRIAAFPGSASSWQYLRFPQTCSPSPLPARLGLPKQSRLPNKVKQTKLPGGVFVSPRCIMYSQDMKFPFTKNWLSLSLSLSLLLSLSLCGVVGFGGGGRGRVNFVCRSTTCASWRPSPCHCAARLPLQIRWARSGLAAVRAKLSLASETGVVVCAPAEHISPPCSFCGVLIKYLFVSSQTLTAMKPPMIYQ